MEDKKTGKDAPEKEPGKPAEEPKKPAEEPRQSAEEPAKREEAPTKPAERITKEVRPQAHNAGHDTSAAFRRSTVRPELAAEEEHLSFMADFKRRLRRVKTTRWIRFAIVSILFCGFVVWLGNPWVALVWLLLLDIYIT